MPSSSLPGSGHGGSGDPGQHHAERVVETRDQSTEALVEALGPA